MAIQVVKIREFNGHSQAVYALLKNANGAGFFSSGGDGMLVKWDPAEADGTLVARHDEAIYCIGEWGDLLLTGSVKGVLSVFEQEGDQLAKRVQLSAKPIFDISVFNGMLLLANGDGRLQQLNNGMGLERELLLSGQSLRKILVMDSDRVAVAGTEGIIWILDADLKVLTQIEAHSSSVFALAFNSKSKILLSGGRDAVINAYSGTKLEKTINAHLLHIHCLLFSPDRRYLLSSSMDKTIKVWDAETLELLKVLDRKYEGHTSSVNRVIWLDEAHFASCSDDRKIILWKIS